MYQLAGKGLKTSVRSSLILNLRLSKECKSNTFSKYKCSKHIHIMQAVHGVVSECVVRLVAAPGASEA